MLRCSIWFSAPSFWMDGGLENRCVGRVYGADGDVEDARSNNPQGSINTRCGNKENGFML